MDYPLYSPERRSPKHFTHSIDRVLLGVTTTSSAIFGYAGYLFGKRYFDGLSRGDTPEQSLAFGTFTVVSALGSLCLGKTSLTNICNPHVPSELPPLPRELAAAIRGDSSEEPSQISVYDTTPEWCNPRPDWQDTSIPTYANTPHHRLPFHIPGLR